MRKRKTERYPMFMGEIGEERERERSVERDGKSKKDGKKCSNRSQGLWEQGEGEEDGEKNGEGEDDGERTRELWEKSKKKRETTTARTTSTRERAREGENVAVGWCGMRMLVPAYGHIPAVPELRSIIHPLGSEWKLSLSRNNDVISSSSARDRRDRAARQLRVNGNCSDAEKCTLQTGS